MIHIVFQGLMAAGISFIYIFLKARQQLQVMHHHVWGIVPVSLAMAFCEVTVVTLIVKQSFWIFIPIGLGGGLGCVCSMVIFKRKHGNIK